MVSQVCCSGCVEVAPHSTGVEPKKSSPNLIQYEKRES